MLSLNRQQIKPLREQLELRKVKEDEQEIEHIWSNNNIKKPISKRRECNKKKRKATTDEEKALNELL